MLYFIKSNGAFLSARGNRGKKTVIAFKNVQNAIDIMNFYCDCEKTGGGMIIQKLTATSVIQSCKNTALDFSILDDADSRSYCLEPDSGYLESLGRAFKET